jgi:hypothetical protein
MNCNPEAIDDVRSKLPILHLLSTRKRLRQDLRMRPQRDRTQCSARFQSTHTRNFISAWAQGAEISFMKRLESTVVQELTQTDSALSAWQCRGCVSGKVSGYLVSGRGATNVANNFWSRVFLLRAGATRKGKKTLKEVLRPLP